MNKTSMESSDYTIIDDSGLLALVDCSAYRPFVGEDWTYERILQHFNGCTKDRTIAVWNCGDGGDSYVVRVRSDITSDSGFRSIDGAISVTGGALHLVSYDVLTMAAQFEDEPLPSKHERHLRIELENGNYRIRLVQLYDPGRLNRPDHTTPDFLVEFEQVAGRPWAGVAWLSGAS
jgi:hypothetical protein